MPIPYETSQIPAVINIRFKIDRFNKTDKTKRYVSN